MDAAITGYLFQPSVIAQLLAGVAGFAAAGSAAAMAVPRIAERLIPRPKQTRLADHMKFVEMHDNHHTVICDDGIFAVVLQLQGTDLKFNDSGRQQALNVQRQRWIEQMNEDGIRIREFFVRDRLPKASEFPHTHGIMEHISHAWADGLPRPLSTEFYIVMSVKDAKNGVARLDDAIGQTVSILEEYRVKPLVDEESVPASMHDENGNYVPPSTTLTPAAFFARMLSPISRPTPIGDGRGIPLSHRMCSDVMSYENDLGMIRFRNGPDSKYAAVFVIEEWSSPMYETHMLELLAFPLEMTIVHDIEPIGKAKGMATIGYQMKIAPGLQPGTNAVEQFASVAQQIERGASDEQELARVQTMIIVYGDTPEEVRRGYSKITQLKTFGITPVWARHTAMSHWFGQFPGYDALNRPQRLLSGEVSIISTFQNTPVGQIRSDWGEGPIAMFETLDGAPYSFQWHVGAGSPPLGHAVVIGPAGQGKAQPLDAGILTPTGWSTMGDMHVGKLVRTPDGSVVPVTGVFPQGVKESFAVEFEDGRIVEACDEHLWKVWNPSNSRYEVKPLHEVAALVAKMQAKGRNVGVPLIELGASELPARDLPLPPYFMGAYLGDGGPATGSVAMSCAEPEHTLARIEYEMPEYAFNHVAEGTVDYRMTIRDRTITMPHPAAHRAVVRSTNEDGVEVVEHRGESLTIRALADRCDTYQQLIRTRLNRGWTVEQAIGSTPAEPRAYATHPVKAALRSLGLNGVLGHEKFVPDDYMNGSIAQRLDLMQGLMDTDGGVENGGTKASFTSTSERLARQVQQLAWSLGAIAKIASRVTSYTDPSGAKRQGRMSWRVSIRADDISAFFSLPRKVAACRKAAVDRRLAIKSIVSAGMKEMQCISVGHADKLYVTDGYVVTHNTTLITFLAAMSLRHESLKAFFFDRGRGCEIITRALNGSYLFFDGEEKSVALNPMQLDDNGPNRLFLRDWLQMIGGVDEKEYVLAQEIADAVEINFDQNLPVEHRNLQKLYNSAFPSHSDLRQRLMAWTNPNQFGSIVCADRDTLDITQRVGGFDFTHILDDERLGPPMVSYLMHRIQSEAKGDPRLIFIDETEPLLRNENFRRRFNEMLQEGRKKRQVVISCFQRPQAPEDVGVGDVVRGQCPTVFFFRNFQAKAEDYKDWNLTARELDFVLGNTYKKNKYSVLVKRYGDNPESVLLNVDLSTLGKYMKVFHSGHVQVHRVNKLRQEHGEDHYLEHYLAA